MNEPSEAASPEEAILAAFVAELEVALDPEQVKTDYSTRYPGLADMLREHAESFDGIASAVQDHVGGVEIDAQIRPVCIFEKVKERLRRLLSGFEREGLLVGGRAIANAPHHFAGGHVVGIG